MSVLRKDYKSMNKKIFVLFIVLILIVAIGFLFSYDKKVIEQEKQNTSEQLDNTEDVEQEVTEGEPTVSYFKYTPSSNAKMGTYLFFGIPQSEL